MLMFDVDDEQKNAKICIQKKKIETLISQDMIINDHELQ